MRRVNEALAIATAGAVGFGGGYYMYKSFETDPAKANAKVVACANQLGSRAVLSQTLPHACHSYEDDLVKDISSKTRFSLDDQGNEVEDVLYRQTVYHLPSAGTLMEMERFTPADHKRERNLYIMFMLAFGFGSLAIGSGGVTLYEQRRKSAQQQTPADPVQSS
jgi:hypothetical protein